MKNEPLTESYFYILLCLYREPNHGYAIMQETNELSQGRVNIGSGTMYGATGNMLKKNWIAECGSENSKERRRLYELTEKGREVLQKEVERLKNLMNSAEKIMEGK